MGALGARAPPQDFTKKEKVPILTIGILPHSRKSKTFESALLAAKVPLKCRAPKFEMLPTSLPAVAFRTSIQGFQRIP